MYVGSIPVPASTVFIQVIGIVISHPIPSLWFVLPFAGVLLSIAILPLVLKERWHIIENYVLLGWGSMGLFSVFQAFQGYEALTALLHMLMDEYIPFVCLLASLYIVSCGLVVRTHLYATPFMNVIFLVLGSILANFIGTTGASMVLIRPYLHINRHRLKFAHGVIFFIFCVSNMGGCLSPIGDPPLFLGYLNGVSFWWPLKNLWPFWCGVIFMLVSIFYMIDGKIHKNEGHTYNQHVSSQITIHGKSHLIILLLMIGLLLLTHSWTHCPAGSFLNVKIYAKDVLRDLGLMALSILAYRTMIKRDPQEPFHWEPIQEVSKVFFVIFTTMIPLSAMFHAGMDGPFASLLSFTEKGNVTFNYFWLTGLCSAFLDNAPTYLVFFDLSGGDVAFLMNKGAPILAAISLGAVFMGAMTYIGNAPNFMVRTIARHYKIPMPSFLGYMLWSCGILLPIFLGVSLCLTKIHS